MYLVQRCGVEILESPRSYPLHGWTRTPPDGRTSAECPVSHGHDENNGPVAPRKSAGGAVGSSWGSERRMQYLWPRAETPKGSFSSVVCSGAARFWLAPIRKCESGTADSVCLIRALRVQSCLSELLVVAISREGRLRRAPPVAPSRPTGTLAGPVDVSASGARHSVLMLCKGSSSFRHVLSRHFARLGESAPSESVGALAQTSQRQGRACGLPRRCRRLPHPPRRYLLYTSLKDWMVSGRADAGGSRCAGRCPRMHCLGIVEVHLHITPYPSLGFPLPHLFSPRLPLLTPLQAMLNAQEAGADVG